MEIMKMSRLLVTFTLILLALSCKKEKSQTLIKVPEPGKEPVVGLLQPTQLLNGKAKTTFNYSGDRLLKMQHPDGTSIVISYDDQQHPLKLENFNAEHLTGYTEYSTNETGQVILAETFSCSEDKGTVATGKFKLIYNNSHQLCRIQAMNEKGELSNDSNVTYDDNGNRKSVTHTRPLQTMVYTYDTKNALFKNTEYLFLLELETENPIFLSVVSNITEVSGAKDTGHNQSYTYNYNANGYPDLIRVKVDGKISSTYEVAYQQ